MHRYDHRIGITGLILGAVILAVGFLTGYGHIAGPLSMLTIVTSIALAYHHRVPNRD
jgi:hypothetical protein